jgi:hypothetical protein
VVTITGELQKREKEISTYVKEYSDLFDIDPNLVRALITQESRFVAEATSPTGAYGYGQFTGIGAKQVQEVSAMTPLAADLAEFTKRDADEPNKGIKAICAFLWWLFNKKYHKVEDKKIQLEAVLTFYNGGGRPAALVIKHGGHDRAVPYLKELPDNMRSQSVRYAPEVAQWYIAWHELKKEKEVPKPPSLENPFDEQTQSLRPKYRALVEALSLLARDDESVDAIVTTRDGFTEVTLIFPGELS